MPRLSTTTKYARLREWLLAQPATSQRIELSFAQIELVLGFTLPASARKHSAWWGNEAKITHSHALAWREAGWQVDHLSLAQERVIFRHQSAQS